MPRPPAINWYRADLRSPLPGGLRRPGRSFISIAFVFLFFSRSSSSRPPRRPAGCELRSIGCRAGWTAGEMAESGRENGVSAILMEPTTPPLPLSPSAEVQGRKTRVIHFCVCWSARSLLFTLPPLSETLTLSKRGSFFSAPFFILLTS